MVQEKFGFPPTYKLIIKSMMPPGNLRVLDLGCGPGTAGEILNQDLKHHFTGVDIYQPYVERCRASSYYNEVKKKDLKKLKIKKGSFDVILLLQVIEHLNKKEAVKLLKDCIKAAEKAVIVAVPNGICHQESYDGNIHHEHKSTWDVQDLRRMGFKVFGQGLKIIYGSASYGGGKKANLWQKIVVPLTAILLPLIMFTPKIAVQLIGVKYLDKKR